MDEGNLLYVVDVPGPAIVGLPTSEQLHLVTFHVDSVTDADTHETKSTAQPVIHDINDLKHACPQQFDTVGNFAGEAKLLLKDDTEAFIDAPRKCSIHMKHKLKQELQNMVSQGVIRKVDEHIDWCSSLAYSTNKDGSIRVFIDPQRLNAALVLTIYPHWRKSTRNLLKRDCLASWMLKPDTGGSISPSRLPNTINNDDVDLDVRVDGLALKAEDTQHLTIALINFPTAKQQLLKYETCTILSSTH